MSHEVFLYCFDAVPMLLAVATLNWIHPGEVARRVQALKDSKEKGDYSTANMNAADV